MCAFVCREGYNPQCVQRVTVPSSIAVGFVVADGYGTTIIGIKIIVIGIILMILGDIGLLVCDLCVVCFCT